VQNGNFSYAEKLHLHQPLNINYSYSAK